MCYNYKMKQNNAPEKDEIIEKILPIFWKKICLSEKVTQESLLLDAKINKRTFMKYKNDYFEDHLLDSSLFPVQPTLVDLIALFLAKEETDRVNAICSPKIVRLCKRHSGKKQNMETEDSLEPQEIIRRFILTLLGWNKRGVKQTTLWTAKPHPKNFTLIQQSKNYVIGVSSPYWNLQKPSLGLSTHHLLLHTLQKKEMSNLFQPEKHRALLKTPASSQYVQTLTTTSSFIGFVANNFLSEFDDSLALFYSKAKPTKETVRSVERFISCLNTTFMQVEQLLFLKENSIRKASIDSLKGFDETKLEYDDVYSCYFTDHRSEENRRKIHTMAKDEDFKEWKF